MSIEVWQIIILALLGGVAIIENLGSNVIMNQALILGTITGLIMGDLTMGLAVGATLQLMGLGIASYGGASIPDYATASIVGTVFAVTSGKGVEFGIGLAVPVALLMIQLDIFARFCNIYLQRKVDKGVENLNFEKTTRFHLAGIFTWGLSRGIPIFLVFSFGDGIVEFVSSVIPEWLTGGLSVAGGMLPAVGIAILLRYLPVKNFISYLMFGFLAVAYVQMPMFGVALLGFALAILHFKKLIEKQENKQQVQVAAVTNVGTTNLGELDEDEYED